jgi:hypothetical protein
MSVTEVISIPLGIAYASLKLLFIYTAIQLQHVNDGVIQLYLFSHVR